MTIAERFSKNILKRSTCGLAIFFFVVQFSSAAQLLPVSKPLTGNVTYTLNQAANPTNEQKNAYAKIKIAMDSSVYYYNTYTSITKKITANYEPSVSTADGNSNGNIRFGSNVSYMVALTAMHEIAHTVGVGTTTQWSKLIVNGAYQGKNGIAALKEIDSTVILKGDSQHFWPYGLNYSSEVKSNADLINHCKIVNAIYKDMFPTAVNTPSPLSHDRFSFNVKQNGSFSCNIPSRSRIELGIFSISGKRIGIVDFGEISEGQHTFNINGSAFPNGLYIYRLNAGELKVSRSFVKR